MGALCPTAISRFIADMAAIVGAAAGGGSGSGAGGARGGASKSSTSAGSSKAYAATLLARQLKGENELSDSVSEDHCICSHLPDGILPPAIADLTKESPEFINVGAKEDNIFEWDVTLQGPPGTP